MSTPRRLCSEEYKQVVRATHPDSRMRCTSFEVETSQACTRYRPLDTTEGPVMPSVVHSRGIGFEIGFGAGGPMQYKFSHALRAAVTAGLLLQEGWTVIVVYIMLLVWLRYTILQVSSLPLCISTKQPVFCWPKQLGSSGVIFVITILSGSVGYGFFISAKAAPGDAIAAESSRVETNVFM